MLHVCIWSVTCIIPIDIKEGSTIDIKEGSTIDIKEGSTIDIKEGSSTDIKEGYWLAALCIFVTENVVRVYSSYIGIFYS